MASYQQGPALQTYQTNPYNLPIAQIAQAVDTRNKYWDITASSLKDTYQNMLGLDLTRTDNKQKLDGYMNQANYKLKTAVQSDLSIAPNGADAMKIFDPIVKDSNIMGDHALTNHYRQQVQDAERFKTKGTGDQYSTKNVNYLLQGLDEYSKDPNASNWQSHYAQRRMYTPYYDVSKEIRDLTKNFKPDVTATTTPDVDATGHRNSEYLITKTDKSSYESKLKAYLSANLSDKAKEQLGIDGSVAYYGNDQVLRNDYVGYNNNKISILNRQQKALQAQLTASSDPDEKDRLNYELSDVQNSISSISQENNSAYDDSFLKRNRDRIAGSIYTDSYMRNVAAANQRIDQEVTYKPDQVALKHFSEDMENQRLVTRLTQDSIENQLDRESREKISGIRKSGTANAGDLQGKERPQTSDVDNQKTYGADTLDKSILDAKNNMEQSRSNAMEAINEDRRQNGNPNFDINKLPMDQRLPFMEQWVSEHQKDPIWQGYMANKRIYDNQNAVKDQVMKDAKAGLDPTETITISTGNKPITLTTKDDYKIFQSSSTTAQMAPGYVPNNSGYFVTVNGKTYPISSSDYEKVRTSGTYSKINDALNKKVTVLKNERVPTTDQQKDPTIKAMRENFSSQFGIKENAAKDIRVYSYDKDGVYFSIPSTYDKAELGISADALKTTLEARGGKVVTREGFPTYFLPYSQTSFTPKSLTDPELKPFQDFFDFKKADKSNGTVAAPDVMSYDPNRIGEYFSFKMDIMNGVPQYKVFHLGSKTYIGDPSKGYDGGFDSLEDAASFIFSNFTNKKQLPAQIQAIKNRNK